MTVPSVTAITYKVEIEKVGDVAIVSDTTNS